VLILVFVLVTISVVARPGWRARPGDWVWWGKVAASDGRGRTMLYILHHSLGLSKIMIVIKYVVIKLNYYDYIMPHSVF